MTPEQRVARIKKLVSAAKALLSLQVGLAVGAQRIDRILRWLEPEIQSNHQIFSEFISAIPAGLPLGSARLLWEPNKLLENDPILSKIENKYRAPILQECLNIIQIYG